MKVSVVIPVYNQAPYLAECLDSVLAQTLRDIEVVCVDDGSTDGSGKMLDEYAARDPRVKVIHQANAGAGPARNAGMDAASGEFVAFMDPDDKYPDDGVLADLVRGAEENGVDICGGSMVMMDGRRLESGFEFESDGVVDYAGYQFEYGYTRYIYRHRLLETCGARFPGLVRFQDVPFCIEALHAAGRFYALRRLVYLYRDGHHAVEWSINGGKKALANVSGIMMAYDLARRYGYERMAERLKGRLLDFVALLCSESNGLRSDLAITRSHRDAFLAELEDVKASESYRLGLALTWPFRKIKQCVGSSSCSSR